MQIFESDGMPLGVVDFGHTPDALEKAIECLIPNARARGGRLWTVFGCGGDRDAGKRPIMGEIAARLSDQVIVTSDNPRTENPQAIVDAIMQGVQAVPGADQRTMAIVDRREAIHRAVFAADAKDIILVAGKGMNANRSSMTGRTISLTERSFARLLMSAAQSAAESKKKYPIDCKGVLA